MDKIDVDFNKISPSTDYNRKVKQDGEDGLDEMSIHGHILRQAVADRRF